MLTLNHSFTTQIEPFLSSIPWNLSLQQVHIEILVMFLIWNMKFRVFWTLNSSLLISVFFSYIVGLLCFTVVTPLWPISFFSSLCLESCLSLCLFQTSSSSSCIFLPSLFFLAFVPCFLVFLYLYYSHRTTLKFVFLLNFDWL